MNDLISELSARAACEPNSDAPRFRDSFNVMQRFVSDKYYPYVRDKCPYFTDHGDKHIKGVIWAASLLLGKENPGKEITYALGTFEIYLLLTAIIWHDVGMLSVRSGHEVAVKSLLKDFLSIAFEGVSEQRYVEQIIGAHTGKNTPLVKLGSEEHYRTHVIHPRALAAILRFADEVSEDASRISLPVLQRGAVPQEQQIFWYYAKSIQASRPEPSRERIVITVELDGSDAVRQFVDPDDVTKSITLVEYVLRRIEKINRERAYCAPHFLRYSSIQCIEARLRLLKGTDWIDGYTDVVEFGGEYPDVKICDQFFVEYPRWNAAAIKLAT
ncbi:MAG: HD domain-containing protein [Verrucomicrobiota bacterium]